MYIILNCMLYTTLNPQWTCNIYPQIQHWHRRPDIYYYASMYNIPEPPPPHWHALYTPKYSPDTEEAGYLLLRPPWGPGVKLRMCPPYPQRDRKRRLNGAVCRNHRIKRMVPCRCWTGTLKNPKKCLWCGSPTVGPTSSSIRLHIYVPSHIWLKYH